jgi:large subunit ribosomal protein L10
LKNVFEQEEKSGENTEKKRKNKVVVEMVLSRKEKQEAVEEIAAELKKFPVIAVADLTSLPSRQFNSIKKKISAEARIFIARKTLLKKVLDKTGFKELEEKLVGSPAILGTNLDAFKLFRTVKKNKSRVKAKPGAIAPADIVVRAGETSLAPGPVLTELKQAGIEARIQGPKVVIAKDCVVAKKGETVNEVVAGILTKLGIEPMEVSLRIVAVLEKGMIYVAGDLDVDEEKYLEDFRNAYVQAINLAVYAEIFSKESIEVMVWKAAAEGTALNALVEKKAGGEETAEGNALAEEEGKTEAKNEETTTATQTEAQPAEQSQ